jgi:hypothetical protein
VSTDSGWAKTKQNKTKKAIKQSQKERDGCKEEKKSQKTTSPQKKREEEEKMKLKTGEKAVL